PTYTPKSPPPGELFNHYYMRSPAPLSLLPATAIATAEADPGAAFEALRGFVHTAVDERIGALCPILSEAVDPDHPDLHAGRIRLEDAVEGLMARVRAAGQLRTDIAVGDLMVALSQLTRPLPGAGCLVDFDQFVHRHLQLFLDGLMTPARSELPGHAATLEELRRDIDERRPRQPRNSDYSEEGLGQK
ncbi:SbtR family transcriptional regulator, partial [Streptomyces lasiicapitis]|uniref:SbtR family transcriptional regulator n=1 Tax=Streptomyces lasiicapitis TaxID=1923961 RepID=UPI0036CC8C16